MLLHEGLWHCEGKLCAWTAGEAPPPAWPLVHGEEALQQGCRLNGRSCWGLHVHPKVMSGCASAKHMLEAGSKLPVAYMLTAPVASARWPPRHGIDCPRGRDECVHKEDTFHASLSHTQQPGMQVVKEDPAWMPTSMQDLTCTTGAGGCRTLGKCWSQASQPQARAPACARCDVAAAHRRGRGAGPSLHQRGPPRDWHHQTSSGSDVWGTGPSSGRALLSGAQGVRLGLGTGPGRGGSS